MFIRRNVKLIRILSLCLASTALVSAPLAGGMETKDNPVPPPAPVAEKPVPNGAFPIQDPGPYQGDLLPPNQNYPDVGLRKETSDDCYCDGGYVRMSGMYNFTTERESFAQGTGRVLNKAADDNTPTVVTQVSNSFFTNQQILAMKPKGRQAGGQFAAGYKAGMLRAEFAGEAALFLGDEQNFANGAVTIGVTPTFKEYAGMMNLYMDLDMGGQAMTPYVGLGAGLQKNIYKFDVKSTNGSTTQEGSIEYKNTAFVSAAMVGTTMDLTKNISVDVGYRLKRVHGKKLDDNPIVNGASGVALHPNGYETRDQSNGEITITVQEEIDVKPITSHEVNVGVRYRF